MAYNSDYTAADMNIQQSNRQVYLSRHEAKLADHSAVDMDPSPIQDQHDRRMLFDSTCDLDHSVLSPWDSYLHSGFLTLESFSATSPSPATRSHTSAIHWLPQSGDVPCSPDETNVNTRKERRREQNRMAQRVQAFRDRKEKAIESLRKELQILMMINQNLSEANEAYARQISELKETIESTKILGTPTISALICDPLFRLDNLELEHGFGESVASLQVDCGEPWRHWQEGECARFREAKTGV